MKSKNLNFKKEQEPSSGSLFEDNTSFKTENNNELRQLEKVNRKVTVNSINNQKRRKKTLTIVFLVFLSFILVAAGLGYFFVIAPIQRVLSYTEDIKSNASTMLADFEDKDLSNIDTYFNNIQNDLNKIDSEITRYDFLSSLDITKGYYRNFQIARTILHKSNNLIKETLPTFKDTLKVSGFKTEKDQVMPVEDDSTTEEDGALTLILKEMPRYLEFYDSIEPKIEDILGDVKEIDLNYVPNIGGYNLKDKIQSSYDFIDQFPSTSKQITNYLTYIPDLVGANDPSKYLLILQNETEMRSSGGLLTAYGFLTMDKGQIGEDIFLTDMWNWQYDLWATGYPMPYNNIYGQNYLMNLGCGGTELRVQDAGIYPDLHTVGSMLKDYYEIVQPTFPDKYPDFDYILFLDENFATNLINIIQPLEVEGYGTVDAEGLYDFIKGETDKNLPNEVRKDIIKAIANAAKEKFLNLPLNKFSEVISTLIFSFQKRDLAIEAPNDNNIQAYLDDYGMSGRMAVNYDQGDYFHLNEAQNCSLKLNKFIRDEVTQDIYIQPDGSIKKEVNVKWLQTRVYEDGLEKQYSPSTAFSYRAWVRFMTPKGITDFNSDGYRASGYVHYFPQEYSDKVMNKSVSDNIVQFDHRRFEESDPIERETMNVSYELPEDINYVQDKKYTLLIQKHNGKSWGEKYIINIHNGDNVTSIDFILDRDKVLNYKNGIITIDNYNKSLDWLQDLVNSVPWDKIGN